MFSAWNFDEWIASVGAALLIFGIVAALSMLIGYVTTAVWGKARKAAGKIGFGKAQRDTKPGTRRAA